MRLIWLCLTAPIWLPLSALRAVLARRGARPVVCVELSGSLPDVPPQIGLLARLSPARGIDLRSLLDLLRRIESDRRVQTLLVRVEGLACGLGRAEELRRALSRVARAGKQVVLHADDLSLASYWVALGATRVHLPPEGALNVSGIGVEITLLKGLLDRVGIGAQLEARGEYKSMRETFTEPHASEHNLTMMRALVDDLSDQLAERLAGSGRVGESEARTAFERGPFRASEAIAAGLVDAAAYWDELWHELGGEEHRIENAARYRRRKRRERVTSPKRVPVGLLHVTGNIRSGHDRTGPSGRRATGSLSLCRAVRKARRSKRLKAVVLRVDSPGGSALASDLMWRELSLLAQQKPLFVSMANVAASGGYYVSGVKGARCFAEPTTVTGSIGVVAGKFELSGLLEHLGIRRERVETGPRAGYHSPTQPFDEDALRKLSEDVDAHYRTFVTKMAEARGLSFEDLEAVARGRVWTGRQARERGLVDELGGFAEVEAALREQLQLADGSEIAWVVAPARRGLSALLGADAEGRGPLSTLAAWIEQPGGELGGLGAFLEEAVDLGGERLLALSPIRCWFR